MKREVRSSNLSHKVRNLKNHVIITQLTSGEE